jgi:isoquinoline 1-oxidoreductase subunit alpha
MPTFRLTVNGEAHRIESSPEMPLLWVLRDLLDLTGTKYGCGIGMCGACMVLIDGVSTPSCQVPISEVSGAVTSIEGLSVDGLHDVQHAWIAEDVPQCGYCQPGQVIRAVDLLTAVSTPTDEEIDAVMASNLCRCGTYDRIRKAIHRHGAAQ